MKRITKTEALALIAPVLDGKIVVSSQERTATRYLLALSAELEALTDHDPVDTLVSQFLYRHFELFTQTPEDEKTLAGLPDTLLALGAHPFYIGEDKKSILSKLIEENKIKIDTYFIRNYFISFLQQNWHAQALIPHRREISFFNPLKKNELLESCKQNATIFTTEKLAMAEGRETVLSHLLKIGSNSYTVHPGTSHYKTYINYLKSRIITRDEFETALTRCREHTTPLINNHFSPTNQEAIALDFSEVNILNLVINAIFKEENIEVLQREMRAPLLLSSCKTQLDRALTTSIEASLDKEREPSETTLKRIKTLLDDGANPYATIHIFQSERGYRSSLPHHLFHAVFQYSLYDIDAVHHHLMQPGSTALFNILIAALHYWKSKNESGKSLKQHYAHAIKSNQTISPLITFAYCASQAYTATRFFGLGLRIFKERLLTPITADVSFIYTVIASRHISFKEQFKNKLIEAITYLPIEDQRVFLENEQALKTSLAITIIRTRSRHPEQTDTKSYKTLIEKLNHPLFAEVDSSDSDDDYDQTNVPFEETHPVEQVNIDAFRACPLKVLHVYQALLEDKLDYVAFLVKKQYFNINSSASWINYPLSDYPTISVNARSDGTLLHKLWLEDEKVLSTERKIKLTEFLIKQRFAIFTEIEFHDRCRHHFFSFAAYLKLPALTHCLIHLFKNGCVELHLPTLKEITASHMIPTLLSMLSFIKKPDQPSHPLPVIFSTCFIYTTQNPITHAIFKKHFLTPLTPEHQAKLRTLLKETHYRVTELKRALANIANEIIATDPAFKNTLFELKQRKTPCAFFTALKAKKYEKAYEPSHYTLFKRQTWPKAESVGPPSLVDHHNTL